MRLQMVARKSIQDAGKEWNQITIESYRQTLDRDEGRATYAQVNKRSSITKGKKELQQALTRATNAPPKNKTKEVLYFG